MLLEMFAALTMQPNAEPIVLRHTRPARDVVASETSFCGDTVFEIQYSSTREETRGTIRARHDGRLIELENAQTALFSKLEYVQNTVVNCGNDEVFSQVMVSGPDRLTGEFGKMFEIGYLPATGFSEIVEIKRDRN